MPSRFFPKRTGLPLRCVLQWRQALCSGESQSRFTIWRRPRQEWSLTHGNRLNLLWKLWFFIGPYTLTSPLHASLLSRLPLPFSIEKAFFCCISTERHYRQASHKNTENSKFTQILDTILLFAMGLGILGVICTGTLNMGGALRELTGMESRSGAWLIILSIVTVCFIISSISGIQKGIKLLSNINVIIYLQYWGYYSLLALPCL